MSLNFDIEMVFKIHVERYNSLIILVFWFSSSFVVIVAAASATEVVLIKYVKGKGVTQRQWWHTLKLVGLY